MNEYYQNITSIILAGGFSKRFGNHDKIFITIENQSLIVKAIKSLENICNIIIISVNDRSRENELQKHLQSKISNDLLDKIQFVIDDHNTIKAKGPLNGILTALRNVSTEYAIVRPVDMPFLKHRDLDRLCLSIMKGKSCLSTYSFENNFVSSLLFAINLDLTKITIEKLMGFSNNKADTLIRSVASSIVFPVENYPGHFLNINYQYEIPNLDFVRESQILHPIDVNTGNCFWRQYDIPKINQSELVSTINQEYELWHINKIKLHILQDAKKIISPDLFNSSGLQLKLDNLIKAL